MIYMLHHIHRNNACDMLKCLQMGHADQSIINIFNNMLFLDCNKHDVML